MFVFPRFRVVKRRLNPLRGARKCVYHAPGNVPTRGLILVGFQLPSLIRTGARMLAPRFAKCWSTIVLMLCLAAIVGCEANQSHSLTEMNKGVEAYREGNYGSAVEHLKEADRIWPENAQANYMLGQIYQHKYEEPATAIGFYEKATTLAPDMADYWYHKGACLVAVKRDSEAKLALNKAVELKPGHADALYRIGVVEERAGKPKAAAQSYGDSIRADARKPFAYYNLGDLYFRNRKVEEAQRVFKNGVENNPTSAELRHGLGVSYLAQKKYREALVEFEEALRLKERYPSALFNIGMAYNALGQRAKAKAYLEKFIRSAKANENSARIAAAEARLTEILESERESQ